MSHSLTAEALHPKHIGSSFRIPQLLHGSQVRIGNKYSILIYPALTGIKEKHIPFGKIVISSLVIVVKSSKKPSSIVALVMGT